MVVEEEEENERDTTNKRRERAERAGLCNEMTISRNDETEPSKQSRRHAWEHEHGNEKAKSINETVYLDVK